LTEVFFALFGLGAFDVGVGVRGGGVTITVEF
jgi:hypothetical protein